MPGTDASLHTALVDAHVHFHACFDTELFLASARDNFRAVANELGLSPSSSFYLLLTETADAGWFGQLQDRLSHGWTPSDFWTVHATGDERHLRLVHTDGSTLNVVAGRQIVTSERLEVLALGSVSTVPDGYPLLDTVRRVTALEAVPVLPWGFGKWLGRRGEKIRDIINVSSRGQIFLGDNSGRLGGLGDPELFRFARATKGITVLPGTDPFPFPGQAQRVGKMGFVAQSAADLSRWENLRAAIVSQEGLRPYGALEQPLPFVLNQVAMQYMKRAARRRAPAY